MANFVPSTIVKVLKDVPLDSTYSDTIKFTSVGAQTAFFSGKAKYSFTEFTYQRVNSSVSVPRGHVLFVSPELQMIYMIATMLCFKMRTMEQNGFMLL